ncbi:MAG: TldD/PmbA family protein [Pseudomonadota bacterium]
MSDDLDIAGRLLDLASRAGADQADVLIIDDAAFSIGVADRALEEAERAESRDIGLRVVVGAGQACVSSTDATDAALAGMAERAVALAREAPEDPNCGLAGADEISSDADAASLDLVDPADPPDPAMLEAMAREAEDAALSVGNVTQVESASATYTAATISLAASNGFTGFYGRTNVSVGAAAIAGEGLGRERDFAGESRRHRTDLPAPAEIGRRAGERAAAALAPRKPPGGAVPVLYDERVASGLIGHLVSAANGNAIARGSSWLLDAMDREVLPRGFDLTEDPQRPRGAASRPFDAEGLASQVKPLVQDGILRRWVLDCANARKLGLNSTGNARRGTGAPPSPGVTNLDLAVPNPVSRDDLIRQMGTGLIVTSFIGLSLSATTGNYSRGASGFWVENGEIAYSVNEVTVAGSLPEILRTIVAADDADPWKSYRVPSLLVDGLTIGA